MNDQIQKGCASVSVLKIQQCLNQLNPEFHLKEDGLYGDLTEQAIKYFQKSTGLDADGCLTSITWDKIILKVKTQKLPEIQFSAVLKSIGYGSKGLDVVKAQQYLNLILPTDPIETNGIFDARTQVKVIRFQNKTGLNPDGRIGIETWNKMIECI